MSQKTMRAGMLLRLATFSSRFSFFMCGAPRGEMRVERYVGLCLIQLCTVLRGLAFELR
jgi:hypothetical protein